MKGNDNGTLEAGVPLSASDTIYPRRIPRPLPPPIITTDRYDDDGMEEPGVINSRGRKSSLSNFADSSSCTIDKERTETTHTMELPILKECSKTVTQQGNRGTHSYELKLSDSYDPFDIQSPDELENKTKALELELKSVLTQANVKAEEGNASALGTFQDAINLQNSIHRLHLLKLNYNPNGKQGVPQPSPTLVSEIDSETNIYSIDISSKLYPVERFSIDAKHILLLGSILLKQSFLHLRHNDTTAASKMYAEVCDMTQALIDDEKLSWDSHRCDSNSISRMDRDLRRQLDICLSYAWNNRGYIFYITSQHRQALLAFKHSYLLKKKILKHPLQVGTAVADLESYAQLEMGKTLHNIGLVYHATAKYSLAIESFKEALHWKNKVMSNISFFSTSPMIEKQRMQDETALSYANTLVCSGCALSIKCQWINIELNENIKLISRELHTLENGADELNDQEQGGKKKKLEESIKKATDELNLNRHESLTLYKEALSILQGLRNLQDFSLATVTYNIGITEHLLGHYEKAVDALQDALKRIKLVENRRHTMLEVKALHALGLTFLEVQKFQDAISSFQDAIHIVNHATEVNGSPSSASQWTVNFSLFDSPFIECKTDDYKKDNSLASNKILVLFQLGKAYYFIHDYENAMKNYLQVAKWRVTAFGSMHESVAVVISAISDVMMAQSAYTVAHTGFKESLKIQIECFGPYHVNVADEYTKLGDLFMRMSHDKSRSQDIDELMTLDVGHPKQLVDGDKDQNFRNALSLEFLEKAAQIYRINQKYSKLSKTLEMSAEIKQILHQDVLALHSYREALDAEFASGFVLCADTAHEREKLLRVARIQNVIGLLMYNVANYSASLSSFSEVLRIKRDILHLSDDTVVTTLVNIGHGHYKMNELTQALHVYKEALKMKELVVCEDGKDISSTLDTMLTYVKSNPKVKGSDNADIISQNLEEMSRILNYIGVVQEAIGDRKAALVTFKMALQIHQILCQSGGRESALAIMMEKVGLLQFQGSKYLDALHSFSEALRLKHLKSNGEPTVDIAHTMNSIGNVYYSINNLDESLSIYQQALKIKKTKLGKDHLDVANTLNNIGNIYHAKGDYNDAIHAYTDALNIKRKQLGPEHLDVASAYCNIGDVQAKRKFYSDSLEVYEEALAIIEKRHGSNHLENAATLKSIAKIHQIQGNTKALIFTLEKEVDIRRNLLGVNHASLIQPLTILGRSYHELRQLDAALLSYKEALYLIEQHLKDLSTTTVHQIGCDGAAETSSTSDSVAIKHQQSDALGNFSDVLRKIGLVCLDKEEPDKALGAFRASLKYKVRQLGQSSLEVALILENIALCLFMKGDYHDAASSFLEALRVKKLNLGEDSDEVATTLNNLGNVYYTLGELKLAMENYAKAFLLKKSFLGDDHLDLATMLNNIGSIYAEEGEIDEAIETYQEALRIREKRLGDKDLLVASTLINLGDIYLRKMNVDASLESYNQALRIRSLKLGDDDVEVASVLEKIGNAYEEDGDHKRAVEFYFDAAKVREHVGGKESLDYALSVEKIALSQIKLGKNDDAMKCLRHVLHVKLLKVGEKHEEVQKTTKVIEDLQVKLANPVTPVRNKNQPRLPI